MTNELTRPLTDAEEGLWQEKLAALLVRQIALYTANESSSVPAAAARELLRGVLFFLAVSMKSGVHLMVFFLPEKLLLYFILMD